MPTENLSVPIINVSSLFWMENNIGERKQTIKEIGDACRDWGFFYVVGHQVKTEFVEKFKRETFEFFKKPIEFKRKILRKHDNLRGYFDQELTKQRLDWKEVFDFGSDVTRADSGMDFDGGNQWPEGMPEFRSTLTAFHQTMYELSRELLIAIVESLNVNSKDLEHAMKGSFDTSVFRLNLYPPCPDPENNLGVGPHSDSGTLTVLLQDDNVASLQVKRDGVFYDIPPVPNSFVVNIADMVQVLSNDLYKAPTHRVLTNGEKQRFSAVFFLHLSYDAVIEPLKECTNAQDPPKYRPFTCGEFRKGRVVGNYADLGEELQISHYKVKC